MFFWALWKKKRSLFFLAFWIALLSLVLLLLLCCGLEKCYTVRPISGGLDKVLWMVGDGEEERRGHGCTILFVPYCTVQSSKIPTPARSYSTLATWDMGGGGKRPYRIGYCTTYVDSNWDHARLIKETRILIQ